MEHDIDITEQGLHVTLETLCRVSKMGVRNDGDLHWMNNCIRKQGDCQKQIRPVPGKTESLPFSLTPSASAPGADAHPH
jgi:hypothetical protein